MKWIYTLLLLIICGISGNAQQLDRSQYHLTSKTSSAPDKNHVAFRATTTDKYRLMYNGNPSTEITIAWNQISGTDPTVYYDTTDHGTDYQSYTNQLSPYRSTEYLGMNNQFVQLTGLTPDTKYYFVIKDSEGMSERFWFRTIPADAGKRLSFIAGGDSRTGIDERIKSNKMVAKLRPHAVFFGGDLIGKPGDTGEDTMAKWLDDWQQTITSDNQIIPVIHSFGNHESNGAGGIEFLNKLFDTAQNAYYQIVFGGDLFSLYILNSELLPGCSEENPSERIKQKNWLIHHLSNDQSIWKSAEYHRPIIPHHENYEPENAAFDDWANAFYDKGVRLVFAYHAHVVKMTEELRPAMTTASGNAENWFVRSDIAQEKGITFLGEGTWATKRDLGTTSPPPYSFTRAMGSFFSLQWIFVDACSIEIRTLDTQAPETITERTEETRFDLGSDIDALLWKPAALENGVLKILKSSVWDGNSWSCGEPNSKKDAMIKANYNHAIGDIETNNLTINSDAELHFNNATNNSVIVHGDLTVDGTFIIGDSESLVMYEDDALIRGKITKIEKSVKKETIYDATYWSSPVKNTPITTFGDVNYQRIFQLVPEAINTDYGAVDRKYEHWFPSTDANYGFDLMQSGRAYSVEGFLQGDPTITVNFMGEPHNGKISYPIKLGLSPAPVQNNKDFNLIGNPYPSAIDPDLFISQNEGKIVHGSIFIWSQNEIIDNIYQQNDYLTYNYSGANGSTINLPFHIASGQGFMVEATGNEDVIFNNSMRVPGYNDLCYRSNESNAKEEDKSRIWLSLTNEENRISELLLGFFSQATDGIDYGWDGKTRNDKDFNFYSVLENEKFAIQGLNTFSADKKITLGFDCSVSGDLTIRLSKKEGILIDQEIFLTDNLLHTVTDLSKGDYTFSQTETGAFKDRFTLQFSNNALGLEALKTAPSFRVSNSYAGFIIHASKRVECIKIYDLLGRLLLQNNPHSKSFNLHTDKIKNGTLLIVQVILENNIYLSKTMVKF